LKVPISSLSSRLSPHDSWMGHSQCFDRRDDGARVSRIKHLPKVTLVQIFSTNIPIWVVTPSTVSHFGKSLVVAAI
jgi:hypothetical protein